ncbi:MAG: T9SS type A sorting domain-containing protein [Bacteroidales bacterium]|nr:T9SS type A sorting domain-containing protein [Bacteroidales bacterium]
MYEFTHIDYELVKTSNVNISLYDTKGSLIEVLINTYKPSGKHSVLWRNRNLDAGIYYLVLNTTNKTITKKIVIKD